MKIYKTALYLRLSREDPAKEKAAESNSIQNQRCLAFNYIKSDPILSGGEIHEYVDDGYSGAAMERPAMKKLLDDISLGKINCIIVKDFSRFARNYIMMGEYLEEIFPFIGVRFISINDNYDNQKDIANLPGIDVAFQAIIHDYYCKELSSKVRNVRMQLNRKGHYLAAQPPYGYWKSEHNKSVLVIDPVSSRIVKHIFLWASNGDSLNTITRKLNTDSIPSPKKRLITAGLLAPKENESYLWNNNTVKRLLTNPVYLGNVVSHKYKKTLGVKSCKRISENDWIVVPNMHQPIITPPDFQKANKRFRKGAARKRQDYLFKGRLICGICGHKLVKNSQYKDNCYFTCYRCSYENPNAPGIHISSNQIIETLKAKLRDSRKSTDCSPDHSFFQNMTNTCLDEHIDRIIIYEDSRVMIEPHV